MGMTKCSECVFCVTSDNGYSECHRKSPTVGFAPDGDVFTAWPTVSEYEKQPNGSQPRSFYLPNSVGCGEGQAKDTTNA